MVAKRSDPAGIVTLVAAFVVASLLAISTSASPDPRRGTAMAPAALTPDGGRYFGPLVDGKLHGEGRLEWEDGTVYTGGFEKGLMSGRGVLKDMDFEYSGEFRKGHFEGRGELVRGDGTRYLGQFVRGHMEGQGRLETQAGAVYEGDFRRDAFTGEGVLTRKDGSRHAGRFVDWQPKGPGRYVDTEGNVYEGRFDGSLDGPGRKVEADGTTYEGEFKDWLYHGRGALRDANGDRYEGEFANGLYHGQGTLFFAAAKHDGRTKDSGLWRWGKRVDEAAQRKERLDLEAALYSQRKLLDAALGKLAPRDPSKINLYLLALAGDGSQEVFHREVRFVQDMFDRQYGTAGRSLALINSRTTMASTPLATRTSLREALAALAGRMDLEQDILFLFLTSHGAEDHELVIASGGMDLPALPAAELGAMLKEYGLRWKVIVVSACYSGGFIDSVKDEHTLVITAARRDRQSFGCADDSDFTYFGRAFFKEALPQSHSFSEAFGKAEGLIREWEEKEIRRLKIPAGKRAESFSLPQMSNPSPVESHLKRWWAQIGQTQTAMGGAATVAAAGAVKP